MTTPQAPRPDGRYDCCLEGDGPDCPQADTGHDLPCNAPYCSQHSAWAQPNRSVEGRS